MNSIRTISSQTRAVACLECGKCTAVCPVARRDPAFSPRRLVEEVIQGRPGETLHNPALWECLTCRACHERCPMGVDYISFVRDVRALAREDAVEAPCSHGGLLQTLMRLTAEPARRPNRLGWLDDNLEISEDGETLYFVGCTPFFEVAFADLEVPALETARSVVRLLNAAGERPQVLAEERCCGHDLLWEGDVESFERLAEANQALIRESGVKRIVSACPEGVRTLAVDYPAHGYDLGVEVLHISQWLAEALRQGRLALRPQERRLTYQDPCRLGRHLGEYEAPRTVLGALGDLVEMERSGRLAQCCGTSCWTACGAVNKQLQLDRLRQARATGADLLVTACLKCQIHFLCAMDDPDVEEGERIEVIDLAQLAARGLETVEG
ncbi:MAG: (Fe-S)-binding protein [Chloroflexia bacterium]|nr:(Fe-S)-binding protein [Chloroflexia bacterium]